jgi:terminal uridylyltransferase
MAFTQTLSPQAIHQQYRGDVHTAVTPPMQRRQASKQRFVADLSQCLFDFVIQLLPTQEEMAVKEDVRKLLERLIRTIEPDSRLLSFGSTANGFSLRNSGERCAALPISFHLIVGYVIQTWIYAVSSTRKNASRPQIL